MISDENILTFLYFLFFIFFLFGLILKKKIWGISLQYVMLQARTMLRGSCFFLNSVLNCLLMCYAYALTSIDPC